MRARRKPLRTRSRPADPPTGAQVVGHGREVLALVELGPVTLEALPGGVVDVAGQGGGGLAVALQEQRGRPAAASAAGAGMSSSGRSGRGLRPAMATALLS
jgi:hypothetical protein